MTVVAETVIQQWHLCYHQAKLQRWPDSWKLKRQLDILRELSGKNGESRSKDDSDQRTSQGRNRKEKPPVKVIRIVHDNGQAFRAVVHFNKIPSEVVTPNLKIIFVAAL